MGAYPESVAIAFGLQFLHVTLEIVAHQLHPMADVAADRFFQGPQLLAGLFADEEPVMHERILTEAATSTRKQVDPKGDLWHSVIESTGQSPRFGEKQSCSLE